MNRNSKYTQISKKSNIQTTAFLKLRWGYSSQSYNNSIKNFLSDRRRNYYGPVSHFKVYRCFKKSVSKPLTFSVIVFVFLLLCLVRTVRQSMYDAWRGWTRQTFLPPLKRTPWLFRGRLSDMQDTLVKTGCQKRRHFKYSFTSSTAPPITII